MEADPYTLFVYALRSPYTKETYFRRLRRLFDAIHLDGPTFESRCNSFAKKEETTLHGLSVVFSDLFTLRKKGRKKGNNRRYITELCKGHQDLLWRDSCRNPMEEDFKMPSESKEIRRRQSSNYRRDKKNCKNIQLYIR
jgi:hypothetical protein